MKLISWNVNGIRASLTKGLEKFVQDSNPDIICFQETKARQEQVNLKKIPIFKEYNEFWNSAEKAGYSGTLILAKKKPISVTRGIGIPEHDQEGRVITADFGDFNLVNVYTPNSGNGLKRLAYRQIWDSAFLNFINELKAEKTTLVCGDLNVAHKEIDIARPDDNHKNAGFTDEEREGFDKIVGSGWIDTFRQFNSEPENYTWWSYRTRARERNIGWRIDYWLASSDISNDIKSSIIQDDIFGSDHCPVALEL